MLFVASSEIINITLGHQRDKVDIDGASVSIRKNGQQASENNAILSSNLRKRKFGSKVDTSAQSTHTGSTSSRISTPGLILCICRLRVNTTIHTVDGCTVFIVQWKIRILAL